MEIVVRGRHMEVSDRFRRHVSEKLARADRFGLPITHIDVEVTQEHNPRLADRAFEVELTCRGAGPVIRAEAFAPDKYSAADLAWGRLEERLRRAADKKRSRRNEKFVVVPAAQVVVEIPAVVEEVVVEEEIVPEGAIWAQGPMVVRLKEHVAVPMSVGGAVEAMELVGHDFYLFHEIETDSPAVIYRRRGFNYGLIRLEGASNG